MLLAFDASQYSWDFSLGIPFDDPVFYINALGLVVAILLMRRLAASRATSGLADGAWSAALVFVIGTGLHFIGDLMNFPEAGDHVLIHIVVAVALVTFLVKARNP